MKVIVKKRFFDSLKEILLFLQEEAPEKYSIEFANDIKDALNKIQANPFHYSMELSYGSIEGDDKTGKAKWEAKYTFSKTGNKIHNKITAHFEFKEGKVVNFGADSNRIVGGGRVAKIRRRSIID